MKLTITFLERHRRLLDVQVRLQVAAGQDRRRVQTWHALHCLSKSCTSGKLNNLINILV
jgi:hypothetical protein